MKGNLSILLALVVLTTSVTLFAATTVGSADYSNVYLDEVKLADGEVEPGTPYRIGSGTETKLAAQGEKLIVQRVEGNKGTLVYDFDKPYNFDYYAFGINFTIDGFTGHSDETKSNVFTTNPGVNTAVFPDRAVNIVDGIGYDADGNVVNKSAWVFAKTGDNANFAVKIMLDEEGNPVTDPDTGKVLLTVGGATLKQGTEYKMTYYVDKIHGTYEATVSDGVSETVVANGQVQNAFSAIAKIEFSLANTVNTETKVIFDNFFIKNESPFYFGSTLPVSSEGTVKFSAYVSEKIENPALYINGVKAEDISVAEGVTNYNFVTQIPESVTFGEAKFEIRGTVGGEAVAYEKTTTLFGADAKREIAATGNNGTFVESEGAFEFKETNFNYNANTGGIYEFHFDFKTDALSKIRIRVSPDANAKGAGIGSNIGNAAVFRHDGTSSQYGDWTKAQIEAAGVTLKTNDYNSAVLKMDYTGNAMENDCPYTLTINGVEAFKDTFKLQDTATINGFTQVKIIISKDTDATYGYFKYHGCYETIGAPKVNTVMAYYDDASSENCINNVVSGMFMDNIKFSFDQQFSNTEGNIYFVDENGAEIGEVSAAGSLVTVKIEEDILPSGTYKLIVDKSVENYGSPLGLNLIIPIEISSNNQVLSPKQGSTVQGEKVTLSAFVKEANKVEFYLNDEKVSGVVNENSGNIYTATASINSNGIYYFDVYAYGEEGLTVTSSSFAAVLPGGRYNAATNLGAVTVDNDKNIKAGAAVLFTGKVVVTGKITLPDTTTNNYINFGTNIADEVVNSGSNWKTVSDAFGYGDNKTYLFNSNGTIGSTSIPYEANKAYNFRYVIDFNRDLYQFFVDGVKVAEYQSQNTSDPAELCDLNMIYFRVRHMGANGVIYDEVSIHTEAESPVVSDIKADGVSTNVNGLYIVPAGAEEIAIELDKAFEDENLQEKISVKLDGQAASCQAVYNKAAKTITLSDLTFKEGQKIEVAIAADANVLVNALTKGSNNEALAATALTEIGKEVKVTMFTGDSNKVCIFPLKLKTSDGSDILAYSRFVNGSDRDVDTFLIITEYSDPETQLRVCKTKFAPIAMGAGQSGAVSGYLSGVVSASGCKVMLWDTDFAPLVSAETLENQQ